MLSKRQLKELKRRREQLQTAIHFYRLALQDWVNDEWIYDVIEHLKKAEEIVGNLVVQHDIGIEFAGKIASIQKEEEIKEILSQCAKELSKHIQLSKVGNHDLFERISEFMEYIRVLVTEDIHKEE